jgi:DNA modification methylase
MSVRIIEGDCIASLATLPTGSAQCCVTSPPYYGLRDYGHTGQIGLEESPDAYVTRLVEVFREVRRVLRDDGVLWLNLGDSYAGSSMTGGNAAFNASGGKDGFKQARQMKFKPGLGSAKPKDLLMIPAQVALALRADGWFLRSDIIWHKPNPMPESVTDRPTSAHEHVFLLTKSARYFYDAAAIAEESEGRELFGNSRSKGHCEQRQDNTRQDMTPTTHRNARNVWTIATQPYSGAHFATMPPDLAERCIKAGSSEKGQCPHCGAAWVRAVDRESRPNWQGGEGQKHDGTHYRANPGGGVGNDRRASVDRGWEASCDCPAHVPIPQTILDPFGGAGTTGLVADRLNRSAILCELNPEYARLARERITGDAPLFGDVS